MRITLCVVGRLKSCPEKEIFRDYIGRFEKNGRSLGFSNINICEVEDKKGGGMEAEATLLRNVIPNGATVISLDERGKLISSPDFADKLSNYRDNGVRDIAFIIGGADGISPSLRQESDFSISFGKMVWPHMLVRVMLSEQLYRAASILAGSPYHRL